MNKKEIRKLTCIDKYCKNKAYDLTGFGFPMCKKHYDMVLEADKETALYMLDKNIEEKEKLKKEQLDKEKK